MIVINHFPLIFLIPWVLFLVYVGIPDIYKILGGTFGFFSLYPIIVFIHYKFVEYRKLLWIFVLTMSGLTVANHIYYYLLYSEIKIPSLAYVVISAIPISWVITGYLLGIEIFIKPERFKDNIVLKNFRLYCIIAMLMPFYCVIPILIELNKLNKMEVYGMQLFFGGIITSGLLLLIETAKITLEEMEYFSIYTKNINIPVDKAKRFVLAGIAIVLLLSTYWEMYRGEWLLWAETATVFVLYVFLQFRFAKVIFVSKQTAQNKPSKYNFPSIKNKKSIVLGLILLALFLSIVIYVMFGSFLN